MTDLAKEQIEALLDGATEGSWLREAQGIYADNGHKLIASVKSHDQGIAWPTTEANGNIMAAAPALARTALSALQRVEYAEAAQALTVERAVEVAQSFDGYQVPTAFWPHEIANHIRAIASDTGKAALAALRAERDESKRLMEVRHREMLAADELMRKHQRRAEKAEAERDTLAASLAAAQAEVTALGAIYWKLRSYAIHDDNCRINKPPYKIGSCSCGLGKALADGEAVLADHDSRNDKEGG